MVFVEPSRNICVMPGWNYKHWVIRFTGSRPAWYVSYWDDFVQGTYSNVTSFSGRVCELDSEGLPTGSFWYLIIFKTRVRASAVVKLVGKPRGAQILPLTHAQMKSTAFLQNRVVVGSVDSNM